MHKNEGKEKKPPKKPSRASIFRQLIKEGKNWVVLAEILKKRF